MKAPLILNRSKFIEREAFNEQSLSHTKWECKYHLTYDNRIEIISPGHLPNSLTVEKIRKGNAIIRNPILVSYVAKGMLPYRGLGSGIKRALEEWQDIDFADDREGCLFTVTVHRKTIDSSGESSGKTEDQILSLLLNTPEMTIPELSTNLQLSTRAIEKQIAKLRKEGLLRRIGPTKGAATGK